MKRVLYFLGFLLVAVALQSCEKEVEFDETLLYGKWRSGTLYYVYSSDYTGKTWDEKDDVNEDEADEFHWKLVMSELQQFHLHIGGEIPKFYTVTDLTETTLRYKDDFNKSYSFTKVR